MKEPTIDVNNVGKSVTIDVKLKGLRWWGFRVRLGTFLLYLVERLDFCTIAIRGRDTTTLEEVRA